MERTLSLRISSLRIRDVCRLGSSGLQKVLLGRERALLADPVRSCLSPTVVGPAICVLLFQV